MQDYRVLILVLMEYGLRRAIGENLRTMEEVLILVLMEYGLRQFNVVSGNRAEEVLILVLMEYGLRLVTELKNFSERLCLNPCFNGIWSAT